MDLVEGLEDRAGQVGLADLEGDGKEGGLKREWGLRF